MNPRIPTPRQLEQLFQDMEDGSIGATDHAWLMDLLRAKPEIRAAYHEHMALATGLHELAEACMTEGRGTHPATFGNRGRWFRSKPFLAAAAGIALIATLGGVLVLTRQSHTPASVAAGAGTVWEFEDGGIGEDGNFLPATRIAVDQGTLQVMTRDKTKILLEGPAVLEIHDPLRVSLSMGKAWFEVAGKEQGFTAMTSQLKVARGTRFGISATGGADRVEVDSGLARLESRFPGVDPLELRPGQAADADLAGRIALVGKDPGLFQRSLPKETRAIHWSFDKQGANGFPSTSTGYDSFPLRITGLGSSPPSAKTVPGRFGSALDFTAGDSFGESDFPGISGSGPRTVAIWVRGHPIERRKTPDFEEYTPSTVAWGDESVPGGLWSLRAHCISGVIGTQWGRGSFITAGVIGSQDVLDGKWHHIAAVYDGGVGARNAGEFVRHYIDGRRVKVTYAELGGGVDTRGGGPASNLKLAFDWNIPGKPGNVPVMVDELHVVRAALSDEQIDILFRENRIAAE